MAPSESFDDVRQSPEVQVRSFSDDGTFPNNEHLPVLLCRRAVKAEEAHTARTFERLFRANGWRGTWRNGIFGYHHYHSSAHEVLGIADGSARVQLGGPEGESFGLSAGDVLILPAGVAHKNLYASSDFLVVGAYPEGQDWDLLRGRPEERPEADRKIEEVSLPSLDPTYGRKGPLHEHWSAV